MSTLIVGRHSSGATTSHEWESAPSDVQFPARTLVRHGLALARIALGGFLLWRFLDHLVGFTSATERGSLHGGSPTGGVLETSAQAWTDRLFMLGLLLAGVSLVVGIGLRLAAMSAVMLYVMSWSIFVPTVVHTTIDSQLIVNAVAMTLLAVVDAGGTWGVGRRWSQSTLGAALPVLR